MAVFYRRTEVYFQTRTKPPSSCDDSMRLPGVIFWVSKIFEGNRRIWPCSRGSCPTTEAGASLPWSAGFPAQGPI
jgi:hypothetical protein